MSIWFWSNMVAFVVGAALMAYGYTFLFVKGHDASADSEEGFNSLLFFTPGLIIILFNLFSWAVYGLVRYFS